MAAHDKARTKLGFAVLLACFTAPALAQTIPLPTPRPPVSQTRGGAPPSSAPAAKPAGPSQALGARAQAPQPAPSHNPISNPFAALLGKANGAGKLTPEQRAIVERVNSYLSGVQMLTGNFVQVGPDGSRTQGDFYIYKPGRVRFEYDDPSPIQLIADGSSVVVRDRKLATQDLYPLSQTPLRFLLADKMDLLRDTNVIGIYSDDIFSTVVIEEKHAIAGTHKLMLMFGAQDLTLRQWTVTDPQGFDTTVAVYNLDTTKKPDPGLFKINYE